MEIFLTTLKNKSCHRAALRNTTFLVHIAHRDKEKQPGPRTSLIIIPGTEYYIKRSMPDTLYFVIYGLLYEHLILE